MSDCNDYISLTSQGIGVQHTFRPADPEKYEKYRAYLRIDRPAEQITVLYSNTVYSTMNNNDEVQKNYKIGAWEIKSLKVGKVKSCGYEEPAEPEEFVFAAFDGKKEKQVEPATEFATDPIQIAVKSGDFICVEIECRGAELPCHIERNYPTFIWDGEWKISNLVPVMAKICAPSEGRKRITFIGDSITQGIGTANNSYSHYAAVVSELIGEDCAVFDPSLGCGRADDAASNGYWLGLAKGSDIVSVCYGVNDIFNLFGAEKTEEHLKKIVSILKENGSKVLIQSTPPFSMQGDFNAQWWEINRYIKEELAPMCDAYFDNTVILGREDARDMAAYGDHPNEIGHRLWGEAITPVIKALL